MVVPVSGVNPVLVARRRRDSAADWDGARSWFGGLPQLGGQAWPVGKDGRALPFGAQIACADLHGLVPDGLLPEAGALAFFLDSGAVIHVPAGSDHAPTPPPPFAVPAYELERDIFPRKASPWVKTTFPYWPVEILPIAAAPVDPDLDEDDRHEARWAALAAAVIAQVEKRQYFLGATAAYGALPEGERPFWWHSVQTYLVQTRIALFHAGSSVAAQKPYLDRARAEVDRLTPRFSLMGLFREPPKDPALQKAQDELTKQALRAAEIQRQIDALPAFSAEVERFCAGRDPWTRLGADAFAAFQALMKRGRKEVGDILRYSTARTPEDLAVETMKAMFTGPPEAFAALPGEIRDLINQSYRQPTDTWHQMFGPGVNIQDAADAYGDHHLLLQLMYDDMVAWRFGDMGAAQFWIRPEDLAARRWDKVVLTYECH